ncbi:MAG: peptidoglycan DD-metalloendopeptidase family protein [Alphaproteobacteria bacterium]|nr:peptidoglycan DD-metalloendopeptidase family protein [Alphaproteobacteria bacterium]
MSRFDPINRDQSRLDAFIGRFFPDREIVVRSGGSVRFFRLSSGRQVGMAGVVALVCLWALSSSGMYFLRGAEVRGKDAEIAGAAAAYEALLEQVGTHRNEIVSISTDLERNRAQLADVSEDSLFPEEQIQQMEAGVESGELLERGAAAREELVSRLRRIADKIKGAPLAASPLRDKGDEPRERDVASVERERLMREQVDLRGRLYGHLEGLARSVASLALERDSLVSLGDPVEVDRRKLLLQRNLAARERDELDARVGELKAQVADMRDIHSEIVQRFSELANASIGDVEKALGAVGYDFKRLVKGKEDRSGQGGPFIPAAVPGTGDLGTRATLASLDVKMGRLENLQQVVRSVPLRAPLEAFRVSSSFGSREDPLNGDLARHEGLDMAAPVGTPVLAPADGVVVYVGWKSRYGRTIIVDHGLGFRTLYGHLNRILVTRGQKVSAGAEIGQVGSTGRSTGPHLHYEVRIDGAPRDPYRFIRAGRHVLKG